MKGQLRRRVVVLAVAVALVLPLAAPAGAVASSNPFVGSWVAVDADGSNIAISIGISGRFQARDDDATTCGHTRWSWVGDGTFDLSGDSPVFTATGDTFCYRGADGGRTFHNHVTFDFVYDSADDVIEFIIDGTIYSRNGGT